jgi:predicted phosphohydrolase
VVQGIGDEDVERIVHGNRLHKAQRRGSRFSAISGVAVLPRACDGLDHAVGIHSSDPVVP